MKLPHPIPYQGSKRNLADQIMRFYPDNFDRLIEPFAGSAAMTIASAFYFKANHFIINDINEPLTQLWDSIINNPKTIIKQYYDIWHGQHGNEEEYYYQIRDKFNETKKGDPFLKIDIGIQNNDSFEIDEIPYRFLHTPGHNLYHITPILKDSFIYFSGDLIISNLTAIYSELDGSLSDYYHTLSKLLDEPIRRMLPSHGSEIEDPKKTITLVKKTLSILEKGVLRRLKEGSCDLLYLMEAAIGKKVHTGGHLPTALGLIYSILRKLEIEGFVEIDKNPSGYEIFRLK